MKISFLKYGSELLMQKRPAPWIIAFVAIGLVAAVCGSFLLGGKLWLLAIAVLCIAGIVLCLGVAAPIFLNKTELNETPPSAVIEENKPITSPQWDYRPRKPIRARPVLNSRRAETSDGPSPDPFEINNNVWLNDNLVEGAAPAFVNGPAQAEESITKAFPQISDSACTAPTADQAAVSKYDQSPIDERMVATEDGF